MTTIFDEMWSTGGENARSPYTRIAEWLAATPPEELSTRQQAAETAFRRLGITFAVYGDPVADERIIPFDIIPRVIDAAEWGRLAVGLEQRVNALNALLNDLYGDREIIRSGILPAELIDGNSQYRLEMIGMKPPGGVFAHIAGVDLVRLGPDDFRVLEDNVRTPSGVSYMIENREAMLRLFPSLFERHRVAPVDGYPDALLQTMRSVAPPRAGSDPVCVVLTPGQFNSAYYEHSFLADKIGIELVEGGDLFVRDDVVYMRTTAGPTRVDVIYRRLDDEFLDPLSFRADSMLGVAGLMSAYRAGNVALVNAPGTGVADDKAIYSYMPEIVRFYSGEEAKLANVETWRCREPDALGYVLDNLEQLVVKLVDGSGGYGMLIGPASTKAEIEDFRTALVAEPHRYIAQPTLALSTAPTLAGGTLGRRHVDLRPFVLTGRDGVSITPGGLTRVALRPGSLVVNSSQGGGTKDTWILSEPLPGGA